MVAVVRLRGFAWAGAMRRGAAAAAPASTAAAASAGGKVARFTFLECADVAKSSAFYSDAAGLRLAPASSASRVVANDGLGLSCELVLLGSPAGAAGEAAAHAGAAGALDGLDLGDTEEEPLIRPFMTIGVSNLKTAARHAKRQFGAVVADAHPLADNGTGVTTQAVFADPDGHRLRALHLYRRTPIVSITLGVSDVRAACEAYARNFGLRVVSAGSAEAAEAHPRTPPRRAAPAAVLAFAPAHASTVLVLEEQAAAVAAAAAGVSAQRAGGSAAAPPPAPVVELALPHLDTVYHHVVGSGWAASPYEPAAGDASFTCADPDGNVFHCTPLPAT